MNKNIILAGVVAIGIYLFSQGKAIFSAHPVQTMRQKVAQKRIAQSTPHITQQEVVRKRAVAERIAQKVAAGRLAQKRIGQPITRTAYIAAARKAAAQKKIRQEAAQIIGKKIGKKVAQKVSQIIKARRQVIAQYAKRQRPQIQRPRSKKKYIASRLFSGAEKSRIIPYSESSRHSYYGPKSHKLQNEGYRVESNKRLAHSIEANHNAVLMSVLSNPKQWKK